MKRKEEEGIRREGAMDRRKKERRGFSNVGNYNCQCALQWQYASPFQILCRSVEPMRIYSVYLFFKMVDVRHLKFLNVGNFNCPYSMEGQNVLPCQILCRPVEPLQRYGRFSIFQDGGRPPSWIYQN